MRYRHKKLLALFAAAAFLFPAAVVTAATTNLQATATFLAAITLTPTDMQFGNITFTTTPGAGDTATLATDGGIAFAGDFASGGGAVAAGDVAIVGSAGQTLDVSCDSSGVLAQASGAGRISVNQVRIANESAAAGGGAACQGVGTVVLSFTLTPATDDQLKVGGRIDGATQVSFAAGDYSTANAGGTSIQVDVVYQ